MPVGKAKAATPETAGEEFRLVVPCFTRVDETRIRDHLRRDQFFWLDLNAPGLDELAQLREIFSFHLLALEDTEHFGERPKLDKYDGYIFLVFFGAWCHGGKDANCSTRCTCLSQASTSSRSIATRCRRLTCSVHCCTAERCTASSSCSTASWMPSSTASSRYSATWMTRSTTSKPPCSPIPPISS